MRYTDPASTEDIDDDTSTMTDEEIDFMDKYIEKFKETPPIAFMHPNLSVKLMKKALETGIPFDEKYVAGLPDDIEF